MAPVDRKGGKVMVATGVLAFDTSVREAARWLDEVMERLQVTDPEAAYVALRATLQALRDRLTADQAAELGAHLPMVIQGMFWEGWHPRNTPVQERRKEVFLSRLQAGLGDREGLDPEQAARAVVSVLSNRIPPRGMRSVLAALPRDLGDWQTAGVAVPGDGGAEAGADVMRVKPPEAAVEEGTCAMCGQRPAVYLGLVCQTCSEAIENNEPWTLEHEDTLAQLRDLEEEEEYQP